MSLFTERKATSFLVVHCSASPPTANVGVKEITQWHRQRGWTTIGYHYVIRRDGTLEKGRPEHVIGAHVEGHNSSSIGICMVGGVNSKMEPEDNFTASQFNQLAILLRQLSAKYPGVTIQGHRDFSGVHKACPSFDVRKWIKETGVFADSHVEPEPHVPAIVVTSDHPTLYSIAKKYACTVAELLAANPHIDPRKMKIGDLVKLPG